ncbi:MAG TPA: TetR/AcrR family transcriptional regulator C-terminal domain-containing protein [Chloroflexota bacterium]|nr:TetR/AcrR family transcriptional regulator C-terminal domain-containing protein [Chloroflexota bacterium]
MAADEPAFGRIWLRRRRERERHRAGLDADRIAAAALRLADAEGLAAVSMRRLATELGAGTMSLYRHVSGRDDVVELIVDAAYGDEPPPAPTGDWRADLRALAGRTRRIMLAHPWLAFEASARPRFGPNALRQAEAALAVARQAAQEIDLASALLDAVQSFTLGAVQRELAERHAERVSGLTEDQWRHAVGPYLRQALAAGEYPHLEERILNGADPDNAERFAFGLDRVLDGIDAWLATVRGP